MAGDLDFSGKSVLITGAASGIGAACARWLAERGAAPLLIDRDDEGLGRLGLDGPRFTGDVADRALWERIEAEAGPLDHAVVNAGSPQAVQLPRRRSRTGAACSRSISTARSCRSGPPCG